MAFDPLHKNSGRLSKEFRIGGFFLFVSLAEEPGKPLWRRCWSKQHDHARTQRDMFIDVSRVLHEYEDGHRQSALNVILGPLSIWMAWV